MLKSTLPLASFACVLLMCSMAHANDSDESAQQSRPPWMDTNQAAPAEGSSLRCFQRGINVVDLPLLDGAAVKLSERAMVGTLETPYQKVVVTAVGDALCVIRTSHTAMPTQPRTGEIEVPPAQGSRRLPE